MTPCGRLLALTALLSLGCSDLTTTDAGIVAIEVTVPSSDTVVVGQTLQLSARVLNGDGESVPAEISWLTPDATISVDSETGLVTGLVADTTGRVQAVSGSLASALVTLTIVDPPVGP